MDELCVMVITGTSNGIGRGMAQHFIQQGYLVAGCSRGASTLEDERYLHTQVDISDEKQVRGWIRSLKKKLTRIDVLVCNAGVVPPSTLFSLTSGATLDSVLRTNVAGTFLVCREVAKVMMKQRFGSIISMSSMALGLHQDGTAAYSGSKAAVVEMTKVLAREMAPVGVTCNVVAPSVFYTGVIEEMSDAIKERTLNSLTIKRELSIEEICNVISFFASPDSRSITGQTIHMGLVC